MKFCQIERAGKIGRKSLVGISIMKKYISYFGDGEKRRNPNILPLASALDSVAG